MTRQSTSCRQNVAPRCSKPRRETTSHTFANSGQGGRTRCFALSPRLPLPKICGFKTNNTHNSVLEKSSYNAEMLRLCSCTLLGPRGLATSCRKPNPGNHQDSNVPPGCLPAWPRSTPQRPEPANWSVEHIRTPVLGPCSHLV